MYSFIRIGLAITFLTSVSSASFAADDRQDCISRYYKKPTYEEYVKRITFILPHDNVLQFFSENHKVWTKVLKLHYAQFNPRDVFCIFGADVHEPLTAEIYDTDGGSLFLFAGQKFSKPERLHFPHEVDGMPILKRLKERTLAAIGDSLMAYCWSLPTAHEQETCTDDYSSFMDDKRARISRDLSNSIQLRPGTIFLFTYETVSTLNGDSENVQMFIDFLSHAQTHELSVDIGYNRTVERTISNGFISTSSRTGTQNEERHDESIASVAQWLSMLVEDIASEAVYKTAIGVLQAGFESTQEVISGEASRTPLSLYDSFAFAQQRNALDSIVSHLLCSHDFEFLLSISSAVRYWHKLPEYREAICGFKLELNGPDRTLRVLDMREYAREVELSQVEGLLELAQREQIGARQEEITIDLHTAILDQTDLINSIKELQTKGQFKDDHQGLMSELRRVEAKLSKGGSGFGDVIMGAVQIGISFTNFGSAAGTLFAIVSNIPANDNVHMVEIPRSRIEHGDANADEERTALEYLWDNRGELRNVGSELGNSVSEIYTKFNELKEDANQKQWLTERESILREIEELELQYKRSLAQIQRAYRKYRGQLDRLANNRRKAELRQRQVDIFVTANITSVVALNLVDNLWIEGDVDIETCRRAIEDIRRHRYAAKSFNLYEGCLLLGPTFRERRECLMEKKGGVDMVLAASDGRGMLLSGSEAKWCFLSDG